MSTRWVISEKGKDDVGNVKARLVVRVSQRKSQIISCSCGYTEL